MTPSPVDVWLDVYREIGRAAETLDLATPWFRGHGGSDWKLVPSLARCKPTAKASRVYPSEEHRERKVFHHFVTSAATLLPQRDGWSVAFAMQHHGVPTRLLDWTTTLAVALYFALKDANGDAAIWILNPYELNKALSGYDEVLGAHALPDYEKLFIQHPPQASIAAAVAFDPIREHPRVNSQRAGFTVHSDLTRPLDDLAPAALRKIVIPPAAQPGAWTFLNHAGVSEFTVFPDLDGLARDLKARYF